MPRFSRSYVTGEILQRIDAIEERHGPFDGNNGWDQVKNTTTERAVAYGAWQALNDLLNEIGTS